MLNNKDFIKESIITNLYYLRTLREYTLRIELSLSNKYNNIKEIFTNLGKRCEEIGSNLLKISNNKIPKEVLNSQIFITNYTYELELLTEKLFNIDINTNLSLIEEKLIPGDIIEDESLINNITNINKEIITLINEFIINTTNLYNKVNNQEIFIFYYNSLNNYLIEEMNIYKLELDRLNQRLTLDPSFIEEFEYYKNNFLYNLSRFLRGEIDPTNENILEEVNSFILEYKNLVNEYKNINLTPENQLNMSLNSLELAKRFKTFIEKCLNLLLKKELYFISAPITKDNLLTAINYFIYNLEKTIN